jgi:nitroimidazol reductase NimA-like FMN-containing flavoprotein (pyridoxamine 5'-phosphate oxidase superfamily)
MTTSQHDLARVARAVIDANCYLTLATADEAGRPWPSPVWYAHAGYHEFFWISSPEARHSRNLTERPEAGIVIFDSHVAPGTAQAVYLTSAAAEVSPDDLPRCVEVFSARSQALGIRRWRADEVRGPAPLRLYRASVSELSVVDGADQRVRIELGAVGRLPAG